MKVFLSYTIRDGSIDSQLLEQLEVQFRSKYSVYIDLLHNKGINPQQEVLKQLGESDLVIQIVTPLISDSEWACLEKELAIKEGIPIHFVNYGQQSIKQLANEILETIASNKRLKRNKNSWLRSASLHSFSQPFLSA